MKCDSCEKQAVIGSREKYCAEHFTSYFERTVEDTIKRFSMILPGELVCVACSGGKDSTALLHALNKLGYAVEALAVDEGIKGYRDETLEHLEKYCSENSIPLKTVSYKESFGVRLDEVKNNNHHCSVCGVWRRKLLNKHAKGYGKLALGHNMDDEAQGVLMNLSRNQLPSLLRSGPVTDARAEMVVRIKPFYFLSEKEVATYAVLHSLNPGWKECPYSREGYRDTMRDWLNEYEAKNPGTKRKIIEWLLATKEEVILEEDAPRPCEECGEPSSSGVCRACQMQAVLQ